MAHTTLSTVLPRTILAAGLLVGAAAPAWAYGSCGEARRKIAEASALRAQAGQEARFGSHGRFCDTLDEIGDRFADAQDAFEDCGQAVVAIDLRSEQRSLRIAKRSNGCD